MRESSEDTSSGRKGRGASVSSVEEPKESKRERKEDKTKSGFDKGLKAEKIIGKYSCSSEMPLPLLFMYLYECEYLISDAN